ncbi:predicted protein [Streptomyces sp. SPB78]|uniref:hypothetical protein n=1 Tax=Streptomyces sp. (strain SPB78) TaxID=591157 RepID=UPI0001B54A1B|nr:hypothetical protein [Streptomyces sp. SPB78]EFL04297.1 predicted protein [Streptomyces sp. SPB78]
MTVTITHHYVLSIEIYGVGRATRDYTIPVPVGTPRSRIYEAALRAAVSGLLEASGLPEDATVPAPITLFWSLDREEIR